MQLVCNRLGPFSGKERPIGIVEETEQTNSSSGFFSTRLRNLSKYLIIKSVH